MLQPIADIGEDSVILEPTEDLTEAFIVYFNEMYVGRVFRSICFPRWLTSDTDERRFPSACSAAEVLVQNWKARPRQQEQLPF